MRRPRAMLRIEKSEIDGIATVRLEGKLLAPWLQEFKALFEDGTPIQSMRLDLKHVDYVDAASLEVLCALRRQGLLIVAASAFVADLLDQSNS
jgi:anti-anti-sigma regulatory factor